MISVKLERVRDLMNAHADDCLVIGYESLIEALVLPDLGDRYRVQPETHL